MRALAIVFDENAGPGVFEDSARAAGVQLDSWFLPSDDPARPLDQYQAAVMLGGSMHPDQQNRYPWLRQAERVLSRYLSLRTPILGVCLGAELLATAAGGTAGPAKQPERGWHHVTLTREATLDPLFAQLAPGFQALLWHEYEFSLPPGAVPLALSDACLQGFRIGRAWGIQFHAEVTAGDARRWIAYSASNQDSDASPSRDLLLHQIDRRIGAWNSLGRALFARFLEFAATERRPGAV